jgi:hypothetical protein
LSIDPQNTVRRTSRVAGFAFAGLAAVGALAADVDFRPAMSFGIFHDGNTQIVGDSTGEGDDVAAISADLTVVRTTGDSTLNFAYRPVYVAHKEHTEDNYLGQSVDLNYVTSRSRNAQYTFDINGYRTERQGVRATDPSAPATFVPRSVQTHGGGRVHGTHTGRRNLIDWDLHANYESYSLDTLEDSSGAGALTSWRYQITPNSTIGLGLILDTLFYETLQTVYVESFGLVGSHAFSPATSMTYAVGASRTATADASDTNFAADVTIARTITDVSSLTAGIRQSVSRGSGLGGVSLDTGGYVSYTHDVPRPGITGSVTAGYWRRDPIGVDDAAASESTNTFSASGSIGWNFNRYLSLNLYDSYSYQTSSDPATLDTQYNSVGLTLNWNIRGR